jgi:hypothetical protein
MKSEGQHKKALISPIPRFSRHRTSENNHGGCCLDEKDLNQRLSSLAACRRWKGRSFFQTETQIFGLKLVLSMIDMIWLVVSTPLKNISQLG